MKVAEIQLLIALEVNKLKTDESYYGSYESEQNEFWILQSLKDSFGFDYEQDEELAEFCLHATSIEIWEYYLTNVLPTL